ncbi:MAG: hypothetical protein GY861_22615 [bacterium]|nr:hypothetical protein [bacterium]
MKSSNVRFRKDQLSSIDLAVENTNLPNRSEFVRESVDHYIKYLNGESRSIPIGGSNYKGYNKTYRRLTESVVNFVKSSGSPFDPIAFNYAGAIHHLEQDKMISLVTQLYSQNPLAHRIIEILADFCVGSNIIYRTADKDLNKVFDEFWNHPRNNFSRTQVRRVTELFLYGEQCYPVFVHPTTGLVQLGAIHPAFIKQTILDPDDYTFVIGVKVQTSGTKTKTYRTIYPTDPETFLNETALSMREKMDGDCFYFAVNFLTLPMPVSGTGYESVQNRGKSDLLHLIDRLGMLDDLNYLHLDRSQLLLSVLWDITVQGGNDDDIEKALQKYQVPDGPCVRAHNERMEVDMKTPTLGSAEIVSEIKMMQDDILGGASLPTHYYGGSGDVNRAASTAMELPTLKRFEARQQEVAEVFRSVLEYQKRMAVNAGRVDKDALFDIVTPAITKKDLSYISTTLSQVVKALESAVAANWITARKAGEVFRTIAEGFGVELQEPENFDELERQAEMQAEIFAKQLEQQPESAKEEDKTDEERQNEESSREVDGKEDVPAKK